MNTAAHALVFWLAGALFGLLLGWTLARRAPAEEPRDDRKPPEKRETPPGFPGGSRSSSSFDCLNW